MSHKHISYAWLILIAELILDGSGHFFEFQGLILRTWLLIIFACFWGFQFIKNRKLELQLDKPIKYALYASSIVILSATIQGFLGHHTPMLIVQDTILYEFLALIVPALQFKDITQRYVKQIFWAFIVGSFLFSFITFVIYSSGLGHVPDFYYHWFRNIAGGKITDLGNYFFRIVLPEHLFLVPLILIQIAELLNKQKDTNRWIILGILFSILIVDFTRIYFIAMALGFMILAFKYSFSRWLKISTISLVVFLLLLMSISFMSSRFNSIGLELVGLKISQISAPQTDLSGAIRMAMLPDIFATIQQNPLLGSGLATMVTYQDPMTKELVSRTQFDWGYFEMIAELGILGTLIFLIFIVLILKTVANLAYRIEIKKRPFYIGLFVGGISLFIINITSPALFQGFGILYLVYLMTLKSADASLQ
ncbi:MAG: O-antigen ligase family protein [Candidatus Magasanikbacteria bacterium]|nr:O-antigen ligase family protein [Candidatus Magasanikbacteria bacterium]